MDSLTFTINFKDINDPDEPQQVVDDLKLLFRFLMNANPNYYLVGNMLNEQLDKQVEQHKEETLTPTGKMCMEWDRIFDEADLGFTAWDMHEQHGDEPVPGFWDAWDNFYHQIGEAMGPVCYAAWTLSSKFKQAGFKTDWINTCVSYYEENWEF